MKNLPAAAFLLFSLAGNQTLAQSVPVGCSLSSAFGSSYIEFSGITGDIILSDYGDSGNISVSVVIEGNGNTYSASIPLSYIKVGNRIEFGGNIDMRIDITEEELRDRFGLLPDVVCTTP